MKESVPPQVVVGIAASAGGFEAMTSLAQHLGTDLPCAYVLAQHMSPKHKSLLSTLLSRETALNVVEVTRSMTLEAQTIYVSTPGYDITVSGGCVHRELPRGHPAEPKPSADRLFASIAKSSRELSVGIVLSGTGSDGSYGVQDIREAGGITISQDPSSCKYDTMPVSAVETGCIDLVLTPRQIGEHLETILARPRNLQALQDSLNSHSEYNDLFQILLARTRVDFREYKENTINRRIQRRMVAKGIERYDDYVALCRASTDEVDALYRDLLISVTRFFRDAEQFVTLGDAINRLVKDRGEEKIRVWVPGCASGEEVYSIAILICEAMGGPGQVDGARVQIFATDIDEAALGRARAGVYPLSAQADIPEAYLSHYFSISDSAVSVSPELRKLVLFSKHNVFQDPPFVDIDIISIRNTLIYFDTSLQERVLGRLHYALRSEGLMFLGMSENLGSIEPFFEAVSDRARVFRQNTRTRFASSGGIMPASWNMPTPRPRAREAHGTRDEFRRKFEQICSAVAPTGFLTNSRREILKIFGDLTEFGAMTDSLRDRLNTNILRSPLAAEASSLIPLSLKHNKARQGSWRELEGRGFNRVRLHAYPVGDSDEAEALVLVSIETEMAELSTPSRHDEEDFEYTTHLENELARAREALQVTTEELQTSNEELQSTNEELQSANEELQSTNEELETSNEELQSTNEELITVNEELLINSEELNTTAAERAGILVALPLPLLTVDQGLVIRNASYGGRELFGLSDRGNHFGHLSQIDLPEGFPRVLDICADVLKTRKGHSSVFVSKGTHYELRIGPYFLRNDELAGLTLVLLGMPQVEEVARTIRSFGDIATWEVDFDTESFRWSEELFRMFGAPAESGLQAIDDMLDEYFPDDGERLRESIDEAIGAGSTFRTTARGVRRDGSTFLLELAGSTLRATEGTPARMVGVARNATMTTGNNLILQHLLEVQAETGVGYFSYDAENDIPFLTGSLFVERALAPAAASGLDQMLDIIAAGDRDRVEAAFRTAITDGQAFAVTADLATPRRGAARIRCEGKPHFGHDGTVSHVFGAMVELVDA
ncbi:chemotaxis protein CheB [Chachezhania antarctica]|uniref:chemotaxis protein CheB n=1 Tax=Chachezhania antarctica TaxID=2340860 RepID=UPI000EB336FB|nr:chemotaxis protein CheB [Chachezhania antarctica]|tara:strand:- start:3140 stop:6340 length:3201 start_codon:yes stop_codon:yes gene_type:complete